MIIFDQSKPHQPKQTPPAQQNPVTNGYILGAKSLLYDIGEYRTLSQRNWPTIVAKRHVMVQLPSRTFF